jgi:hypothetical protein
MWGRCGPKARGSVTPALADPAEAPVIRFNYMSHPDDWTEFRSCIRLTREIFAQPAFAPYAGAGDPAGARRQSDEALDAAVREHAESAYHPCGTCAMGRRDDPGRGGGPGLPGDRGRAAAVADSSVFPRSPTAISTRRRSWWAKRSRITCWALPARRRCRRWRQSGWARPACPGSTRIPTGGRRALVLHRGRGARGRMAACAALRHLIGIKARARPRA